ncbi:Fe-S protein assembly co-chaperone HscB [Acinetobacter nectaris CIP 110549]|uniref:Co-chaperone protein HscB homolog n=1 Tax=Acinetobacter nectaris CIP 110549 TaxID=1392540 RepID=V2V072_9GAMM|nr:Fe-S protein assembly co-chaperone HscB [Acinetobacter nectaris]ESK40949.1 Fe-S protein assembly co-chaperone HscB [Acinetobacter nectaris CIP 110549]
MNYFELFNLPVELSINLAQLKATALQLQQQYHPDRAEDKDKALIQSSEINHAYKVLSQVDSRAAYLLSLKKEDHDLDQSIRDLFFLQEALELREDLENATSEKQILAVKDQVNQAIESLTTAFQGDYHDEQWDSARENVRKLQFFQCVLNDTNKAEEKLFDDQFDLNDDF